MINPWQKISSSLVFDSPWIKLRKDNVVNPGGKEGVYGVVKTKGGIGVVAISDNNELYLVGQYRYAPDTYSLEIPKGAFTSFESRETPLDVAKRELQEETGITTSEWYELGTVHTLMGYSDDMVHLFLARNLSFGESAPEETEDISVFIVPFDQIGDVIKEGLLANGERIRMTDATSIAAIYLARDLLNHKR